MATRTRKTTTPDTQPKPARKRAPRKTSTPRPRLSLAKPPVPNDPQPTTDDDPQPTTIVDLRHPLKPRRRLFVGPMGPNEQAAIRAALAAAANRLPIPVSTWNGSTAQLADGTLLIHNPGPDRTFTAHIACPHGAIHGYPITTHTDLQDARTLTHACERDHTPHIDDTGLDWDKAITRGIYPAPAPKPPAVLQLREGVRRANAAAADTQPLSLKDIADGVTARAAADTETPKEHPDHE